MALPDPQSITVIGTTATTLPRTETDKSAAAYSSADQLVKLSVSHQYGRRRRTLVGVDVNKISPDPLTDVKMKIGASVKTVIDQPLVGFSIDELVIAVQGHCAWLTANSGANLKKVLAGES